MVSLVVGRSNKALLQTVADLAAKFGSGVIGVAACRPVQVAYSGYSFPAKLFDEDRKQIDRELRTAEVEFRGTFGDRSTRLESRACIAVLSLSDHVVREARGADVIVVGVDLAVLDINQSHSKPSLLEEIMMRFLYRCPITGMNVQGRVEANEGAVEANRYKPLTCSPCGRVHLIDPNTGRLLTDTDEFKRR